jgi:hypothetical protein
MAIYYARASGNINGSIWSLTPTGTAGSVTLNSSDILMSNSFTVTINVDTTVSQIRNDTANGATNGGEFILGNNIRLTSDIYVRRVAASFLIGGLQATNGTIIGNIYSYTGGGTQLGISVTGNLVITGNLYGAAALCNCSSGTVTIIGNVYGSNDNSFNVATVFTAPTSNLNTGGTINIIGAAFAGDFGIAAQNTGNNTTLIVIRAVGNGFGNGSTGKNSVVGVSSSQTGLTQVYEIEYGDLGQSPTSGPVFLIPSSTNVALFYRPSTTQKTLISGDSILNVFPNASNVRKGISFNAGNSVGTMSVPPAQSVASGVPVDNTTGTAVLTIDDISKVWDVPVSSISVSGSIGERLKNCSTVATMGQQLAQAFSNIN